MLEVDDNPIPNFIFEFTKTAFDILRNSLIVAALGYFYEKTHSTTMSFAYNSVSILLGLYVGAIFTRISFKTHFFSDSTAGGVFRILISGFIFLIVSTGINIGTTHIIKDAISAQSSQAQPTP